MREEYKIRVAVLLPAQSLSTPTFIQIGTKISVAPIAINPAKKPATNPAIKKYQTFV